MDELNKIKNFISVEPELNEDEYNSQLATLATDLGIWKSDVEKLMSDIEVSDAYALKHLRGYQEDEAARRQRRQERN